MQILQLFKDVIRIYDDESSSLLTLFLGCSGKQFVAFENNRLFIQYQL